MRNCSSCSCRFSWPSVHVKSSPSLFDALAIISLSFATIKSDHLHVNSTKGTSFHRWNELNSFLSKKQHVLRKILMEIQVVSATLLQQWALPFLNANYARPRLSLVQRVWLVSLRQWRHYLPTAMLIRWICHVKVLFTNFKPFIFYRNSFFICELVCTYICWGHRLSEWCEYFANCYWQQKYSLFLEHETTHFVRTHAGLKWHVFVRARGHAHCMSVPCVTPRARHVMIHAFPRTKKQISKIQFLLNVNVQIIKV